MKLKDWIELSTIMGELEGLSMAIEKFKDYEEAMLVEALREIVAKLAVIKDNTMSDVEELKEQLQLKDNSEWNHKRCGCKYKDGVHIEVCARHKEV